MRTRTRARRPRQRPKDAGGLEECGFLHHRAAAPYPGRRLSVDEHAGRPRLWTDVLLPARLLPDEPGDPGAPDRVPFDPARRAVSGRGAHGRPANVGQRSARTCAASWRASTSLPPSAVPPFTDRTAA